jgi:hypothetical protein
MYHAQAVCCNPLTGRKVWLLREIPSGGFGDDWVSSLVVVRKHGLCRRAELLLAEKITSTAQYSQLRAALKQLDFYTAFAMRHGRMKTYKIQ